MAITIKDIAKAAGVSRATVSRVLNNSGYVKEETRQRVLDIIEKLNYTPSAIAKSLSTNKTNTIGVLVPEISNPFFGEIIKGISQVAKRENLNIILCDTDDNIDQELKALEVLKEQRIQGIIITLTSGGSERNRKYLSTFESLGVPVVLIDGHTTYSDFRGVFIDHVKGGFDAISALIREGHRDIAIITGDLASRPARKRLEGYKKALEKNNIEIRDEYIFYGDYSYESSYKRTKEILKLDKKPSAIFVTSNMMILGCIKALREENLEIPKDMAIIGFDKLDVLSIIGMDISFVNGPTLELGKIGMKMLIDSLNNKEGNLIKNITLSPKLTLKGSEKLIIKD